MKTKYVIIALVLGVISGLMVEWIMGRSRGRVS